MGIYQYEAIASHNKKQAGTLDADNLSDAKQKLAKLSLFVVRIEPLGANQARPRLVRGELLNFSRELSRLLQAGLPLYESLSAMEEKYRGQKAQKILLDLCEQVRAGKSFSAAIACHDQTFGPLFIAMVSNAEKTGRLGPALQELCALQLKEQAVRKQVVGALLYPSILFGFCLFVLLALLFYVIPSLNELFEGRTLHPFTQCVFAVSRWACSAKPFLLGFASLGAILFLPRVRKWLFRQMLQLPGLKSFFAKAALIRFFRAASTLLAGSVPIVTAFAEARRVIGHPILEQTIERAEEAIKQGLPVHVSFMGHALIPPLVPRMLAIAEKGGGLDGMMRQIAEIYEEELERAIAHFSTVAQPLLLLCLGVIIGFVLLSVLLPMTDVSSFATE